MMARLSVSCGLAALLAVPALAQTASTAESAADTAARGAPPSAAAPPEPGRSLPSPERPEAAELSEQDREFLVNAVNGQIFMLESSRMALGRAERGEQVGSDVQRFAETALDTHRPLHDALVARAEQEVVMPPADTEPPYAKWLALLQQTGGPAFDDLWLRQQADAHGNMVERFEAQVAQGEDADVVALARDALPMLRSNLEDLQAAAGPAETAAGPGGRME